MALTLLLSCSCLAFHVVQGTAQDTDSLKLPAYTGPKKRAAVGKFEIKTPGIQIEATVPSGAVGTHTLSIGPNGINPTDFGDGMALSLITALIDSKRFVVLERAAWDELTAEQARSGLDPATVAGAGKVLGAQVLFLGAITGVSYRKTQRTGGAGILGAASSQVTFTATTTIDLRVVDVETFRVIDSVQAEGQVTSKASNLNLQISSVRIGSTTFDSSPIGKSIRLAINDAIKKVIARTDALPWEARIATINSNASPQVLYLNFGNESNLPDGTELEIFRPGALVVDPQTKVVIGREDGLTLGTCKIRNSTKTMTVATVLEGTDIQPGDGVRLKKPNLLSIFLMRPLTFRGPYGVTP